MERVYKREGILFKILPCLLITMYAVMCLIGSYVCATSNQVFSFDYNGNNYTVSFPDNEQNLNNVFCFRYGPTLYVLTLESSEYSNIRYGKASSSNDSLVKFIICNENGESATNDKIIGHYYPVLNLFSSSSSSSILLEEEKRQDLRGPLDYDGMTGGIITPCFQNANLDKNEFNIFFSSNDIYSLNGSKVVFQGARLELATLIRPQVQGIQLQTILQEIIQILPIIIVVIVVLIAIRKAIHLLLTVLRNS